MSENDNQKTIPVNASAKEAIKDKEQKEVKLNSKEFQERLLKNFQKESQITRKEYRKHEYFISAGAEKRAKKKTKQKRKVRDR